MKTGTWNYVYNSSNFVVFDVYGKGNLASFGQLGQVEQGLSDIKSYVPPTM